MWPFTRRLDDLREDDLWELVGVMEGPTLDFKRQMYSFPQQIREMRRDVAAFANAEGGIIVIGLDEDGEARATEFRPVPNAEQNSDRLLKLCLQHIHDRIPGLRAQPVRVGNGDAIIVYIPRSYRRPHMVAYESSTEFVSRHERKNLPMSLAEIRTAFASSTDSEMKVERFTDYRRQYWTARYAGSAMLLMATPLFLEESRLDIRDSRLDRLLSQPPAAETSTSLLSMGAPKPTLHGYRTSMGKGKGLEVYRSGHVELILPDRELFATRPIRSTDTGAWTIQGDLVVRYLRDFMTFVAHVRDTFEIADPFAVTLTVFNPGPLKLRGKGEDGEWDEGSVSPSEPAWTSPCICSLWMEILTQLLGRSPTACGTPTASSGALNFQRIGSR